MCLLIHDIRINLLKSLNVKLMINVIGTKLAPVMIHTLTLAKDTDFSPNAVS